MTMLKGLLAATISLAGITAATTADAAIVFNISNGAFRDGAAITGSFTTSDDRSEILDFSVTTGAGFFTPGADPNGVRIPTTGFTFASANSSAQLLSNGISLNVTGPDQTRRSLFINYRVATGVLGRATPGGFAERAAEDERNSRIGEAFITPVAASATGAVPEPATWAMMLIGFGGMGFTLRRRAKVTTRIRFA